MCVYEIIKRINTMIKYRKVFGFLNRFFSHFTPFYHLVNEFSMIFASLAPRLNNKNKIKIDGNFISILLFDVSTSLNREKKNRMVHRAVCRFHLLLYLSGIFECLYIFQILWFHLFIFPFNISSIWIDDCAFLKKKNKRTGRFADISEKEFFWNWFLFV